MKEIEGANFMFYSTTYIYVEMQFQKGYTLLYRQRNDDDDEYMLDEHGIVNLVLTMGSKKTYHI